MAFEAQVRLADVPGLERDRGLLSFHYCLDCTSAGDMSAGHFDGANHGYAVTLHEDTGVPATSAANVPVGSLPAMTVAFSDVEEAPSLEKFWALGLEVPDGLFDGGEDDFDERIGLGLVHVARSKLGGWPHWQQSPEWPTCPHSRRMTFIAQLDWDLGQDSPWASGGYAYLFVCGEECTGRAGELVIQTT